MLYSLISSKWPAKYLSQTKLKSRTRLLARPSTPHANRAASSSRSISCLLIADCTFCPSKRRAPGIRHSVVEKYNPTREPETKVKIQRSHALMVFAKKHLPPEL